MESLNIVGLLELYDKLTSDLLSPETSVEDKKEIRQELEIVTKAIRDFYQLQIDQDKLDVDREKIDADIKRAEIDAETKARQAEADLKMEIVKGGFSLGATGLGGFFMGRLAKKIVDREDEGELVKSAAMSVLNKINLFK